MTTSEPYSRQLNPALIDKLLEESPYQRKITPTPNDSFEDAGSEIIMVVDLGDGRKKDICISREDDANALAQKFCFDNNIDGKVIPLLTKNIRSFMASSFREHQPDSRASNINASRITERSRQEAHERRPTPPSKQKSSNHQVNTSTNSVFERLYNSSVMRDEPAKSEPLHAKDKENKNPNVYQSLVNNGVMIYERNTRLTEYNKRKIQRRIEYLRLQQETSLTFQPEINPISKLMVERIRELSPEYTIQERNSRVKKEKILQYRIERDRQYNSLCTFHPQTNRAHSNSMYVSQQHSRSTDRFNELYAESTARANRKEKLREQHSQYFGFKPKINRVSEYIVNGVKFEDRMRRYNFDKATNEERLKRYKNQEEVYDSRTGIARFHPQTGRAPTSRNRDALPIGHYLYNNRFSKDRAIMRLKEKEEAAMQQACANEYSSKIYAETKLNSLLELFAALDDDADGVISSRKINISEVNPKVLQILSPLLNEMEELNAQLSEAEFIEAVERLFRTLSVADKNIVIRHNQRKKSVLETSTFQPSLNERSLEIASSIRQSNSRAPGVSLYYLCEYKKIAKETSLSRMRTQKQQEELKECTFQPRTTPIRKRSTTLNDKRQKPPLL